MWETLTPSNADTVNLNGKVFFPFDKICAKHINRHAYATTTLALTPYSV